jgi:2-polyprenyl-3-methyl-5-hydroxy-6-metoxy-1,4-benzoquinol methylase
MTRNVDKEKLNEIAARYHLSSQIADKQFDHKFHNLCMQWVVENLKEGSRVLEMGFGEGNVTKGLLEANMKVEIVEGAALLVQEAHQKFGNDIIIHHELFENFKPKGKFDCILATNILEHVDDPLTTLEIVSRWCDETTLLVVTVPNAMSFHRRLAVKMGLQPEVHTLSERDHLVGHQRVYDYEMLVKQVNEIGFRVVAEKGFLMKVLPNSMMKEFPQNLVEALYEIANELPISFTADMGLMLKKTN